MDMEAAQYTGRNLTRLLQCARIDGERRFDLMLHMQTALRSSAVSTYIPARVKLGFDRDLELLSNTLPPDKHRGYSLQWFALAAAVLITALILTFRRPRRGADR